MDDPQAEPQQQSVPQVPQPPEPVKRKKPAMGILSFVFALIPVLLLVLAIVYIAIMPDNSLSEILFMGLMIFSSICGGLFILLAIIFGIIGLVQKNRSKVFAIIGTAIGGLQLSAFLVILIWYFSKL